LSGHRKLGIDSVIPQNFNLCQCPAATFSTTLTTISKITRDQKIKLLDENDEVIRSEVTHKEAHDEAKHRNLQLASLNDPKTNDVVAFKLMTTEQYKIHHVNSQQKNARVKIFKINSASSEHDRDIQYGKIEKVLKKGHPASVTVIDKSRTESEVHTCSKAK
jgi:translation initiation factor IF-3